MAARAAHSIYFDGTCLAQSPRVLFLRLIFLLLLCSSRAPPAHFSSSSCLLLSVYTAVVPSSSRGSSRLSVFLLPRKMTLCDRRRRRAISICNHSRRHSDVAPKVGRIGNFRIRERGERRPRPSARDMNVRALYNDKSINPARGKNSTFRRGSNCGIKVSRICGERRPVGTRHRTIDAETGSRSGETKISRIISPDRNRLIP